MLALEYNELQQAIPPLRAELGGIKGLPRSRDPTTRYGNSVQAHIHHWDGGRHLTFSKFSRDLLHSEGARHILHFHSTSTCSIQGGKITLRTRTDPYSCSHYWLNLTGTRLSRSSMPISVDMLSSQPTSVSMLQSVIATSDTKVSTQRLRGCVSIIYLK